MATGKTLALTIQTFVSRVMSLLFNTLSRFVLAFLPRRNHLLISWLQSPSVVSLEPKKRNLKTLSSFPFYSSLSKAAMEHREGVQHRPSAENWIKDLLSRALQDLEQELACPTASISCEEAFKSLLSLTIRCQIEWKLQSKKLTKLITWITACIIQWSCESCHVGLPNMDGSW